LPDRFHLDEVELRERFVLAAGPGGQNVNKVATAVELRVRVESLTMLDAAAKNRLKSLAGKRLTQEGEIVILARRYRSQERNRQDARARLSALVELSMQPKKARKKTRKSANANKRRLDAKRRKGETKRLRGNPPVE
jgi:ribosome-associated protein